MLSKRILTEKESNIVVQDIGTGNMTFSCMAIHEYFYIKSIFNKSDIIFHMPPSQLFLQFGCITQLDVHDKIMT